MPFSELHILSFEFQEKKKRVEYVAVIDFVRYFKLGVVIMRKNKSLFIVREKKCECHGALEIQYIIRLAINTIPIPS